MTPCGYSPRRRLKIAQAAALFACLVICETGVVAQTLGSACGSLANAYGPYDYRTAEKDKLGLVERPHFPPVVEALIHGNRGTLGGDLDYTLRAFPNHHRALVAVMRYGERAKSPQPPDLRYPVECYFDRAVRFRPDDVIVRMLFAQFFIKNNRPAEANQQLAVAKQQAKDDPFSHYNIGLLYFDLKEYDQALIQAHLAMDLGLQRTELRQRLIGVGKWADSKKAATAAEAQRSVTTEADGAASSTSNRP